MNDSSASAHSYSTAVRPRSPHFYMPIKFQQTWPDQIRSSGVHLQKHTPFDCRSLMYCIFILLSSFLWLFNLFLDDCFHLRKRDRCKIIVVHSDIILCRKKHTQPGRILSGIVSACMHVSEKLPCTIVWATIAKERTVVQVYLLFIYLDIHLHWYMLEVLRIILPQVLDVVVAGNKVNFPVQPVQYIYPFGRTSQTEITQWNTISSGPTTRFQLEIIASFMCDTSLKGLLQNLMILAWLKWVSDVKNTLLPSNLKFIIFSFMRISARLIICYNSTCGRNWRRI